jgi:hypothetical protein
MDLIYYLADFTVAEFKAFKKAVAILTRAGMQRNEAIDMLISSKVDQRRIVSQRHTA